NHATGLATADQFLGERLADEAIDRATKLPRSETLTDSAVDEEIVELVRQLDAYVAGREALETLDVAVDDAAQRGLVERLKQEDLVDAIHQFGAEVANQFLARIEYRERPCGLHVEAQSRRWLGLMKHQIRGQDDDGVAEIGVLPMGIAELPFI